MSASRYQVELCWEKEIGPIPTGVEWDRFTAFLATHWPINAESLDFHYLWVLYLAGCMTGRDEIRKELRRAIGV